ncbi:glycosyltransferase [Pseudomonas aeruginosa]|uniref:glycosyltransferase n=1 Tax=Pseudomonas aeruginosa TaxID=287 RepID=UPI0007072D22|nr:glycosyltransferase [Pseudomonas aeruginosa]ELP1281287.1 glycosyltransferase [Pseudomonas aeruginosa]KAB0780323.1 glycosyltransferase [Pseudomonas aeruginosa]KQK61816.1 glycosyltransferase [Pseudomonas aeruginosa]KQK65841.1 glycosyltransferase [Pseudomonas aeruginosa]MBX6031121.1 glycosyltransferase [Pseudomonas aeruginosa]
MNFILYSDINERSIGHNLGRPEYSYYFVLKAYRPILESLGQVYLVQSTDEVDPLYRQLHEQGEDCLFLSFTPPHKAARGLQCPMLCVVAWEFESIPDVAWDGDPAQDWSQVLAGHGAAITLSEQTARAVRRVLGEDFPVLALPTPIWEDFAAIRQQGERNPVKSGETLQLKGCVIDSRLLGLSADGLIAPIREETEDEIFEVLPETPAEPEPEPVPEPEPEPEPVPLDWRRRLVISKHYLLLWYREAVSDLVPIPVRRWLFRHLRRPLPPPPTALETLPEPLPQAIEPIPPAEPEHPPALLPDVDQHQQVVVDGVVYVSVFNPLDGRKNWHHLITAFCWAFRDTSDATLVLKMTQSDLTTYHVELLTLLSQLSPFACRVIALHGYLDAAEYARLYGAASYYVNASRCEGLCLPLMEFMSCGTPAIAPDHSAMADYMDAQVGFVVRSSQEPAAWPQDSRRLYSTRRYRPSWESLKEAYLESYRVAREQPERYRQLSAAANQRMRGYCAGDVVRQRLEPFLSARKATPAPGVELAATATGNVPC